jgi:hypothetical protein
VDLAVTPILPSPEVDQLPIPLVWFFAREDFAAQNIGEGAKIVLSGYSYKFAGEPHPLPLIREGILSMIPDAPLLTTLLKPGTVYLGDVHYSAVTAGRRRSSALLGYALVGSYWTTTIAFLELSAAFILKIRISTWRLLRPLRELSTRTAVSA